MFDLLLVGDTSPEVQGSGAHLQGGPAGTHRGGGQTPWGVPAGVRYAPHGRDEVQVLGTDINDPGGTHGSGEKGGPCVRGQNDPCGAHGSGKEGGDSQMGYREVKEAP